MARERKIARSYATALFDLSVEKGLTEEIMQDMTLIRDVLLQNKDLEKVLASPVIKRHKKNSILGAILNPHIHELTSRFLHLLVKALRVVFLAEIAVQYISLYKIHKGIQTVSLRTAIPVSGETRDAFSSRLKELLQSEIELIEITDPALIGGFVVQVEDTRYDASIRSKLNKLDRQFDINIYKKGF